MEKKKEWSVSRIFGKIMAKSLPQMEGVTTLLP
jgi:hypothetical protein